MIFIQGSRIPRGSPALCAAYMCSMGGVPRCRNTCPEGKNSVMPRLLTE